MMMDRFCKGGHLRFSIKIRCQQNNIWNRKNARRLVGCLCLAILWLVEWYPLHWQHQLMIHTIQIEDSTLQQSAVQSRDHDMQTQPQDEDLISASPRLITDSTSQSTHETAAICSIVKDENRYLEEWTSYHLALGFERIYLYDNSDTSNAVHWLREDQANNTVIQKGVFVHRYKSKDNKRQIKGFQNCVNTFGRNHTWIALFDPDEFLVLKRDNNVVDMLRQHCHNGSLGINWVIFGTSNKTVYEDEPVTKRFQYHMGVDGHVKTIVKVSDYMGQKSAHWVKLPNPQMRRDTSGQWIKGPRYAGVNNPAFNIDGPIDVAALYHYKYKSLEEFNAKGCSRGYIWNQQRCFNETLADLPVGNIWDDTAWQHLQKLVPSYRSRSES